MNLKDREAARYWDKFKREIQKAAYVDYGESAADKAKRIARLEADPEAWKKYYFPNYYKSDAADFHLQITSDWINNDRIYIVCALARELGKSVLAMMNDFYLMLTKRASFKVLVSASFEGAVKLLAPYKIMLESNPRIIHDYGEQKGLGQWEAGHFTTKTGFGFAAIGAGQTPRGIRLEDLRPDILDIDDIDTDEDCRNPKMIKQKWEWIEQALIPTMSVSGKKRVRFNGNIIAKYCCITEAIKKADHVYIVNIRDDNGNSTWPAKNPEHEIDWMLSKISYISAQKEYFNNPISEGTVFKEMFYKDLPALKAYKFLVCYIDLSYKSGAKNDYKAAVLMGRYRDEYHIIKCFLKQCTTRELAEGLKDIQNYVHGQSPIYFYAEDNFLQDIVIKELQGHFKAINCTINISSDKRKKADKFHRIESTLEPLNKGGKLYLNALERHNIYMQTLDDQFRSFEAGSRGHDDGPDATEGAKQIIDIKNYESAPPIFGARGSNAKRF